MVSKNTRRGIMVGTGFLIASGTGLLVAGASKMPKWNNPIVLFGAGVVIMLGGVAVKEYFR